MTSNDDPEDIQKNFDDEFDQEFANFSSNIPDDYFIFDEDFDEFENLTE